VNYLTNCQSEVKKRYFVNYKLADQVPALKCGSDRQKLSRCLDLHVGIA